MSLDTQTCYISCVIDYPFNASLNVIADKLRANGYVFAFIRHDKDHKMNSNGEMGDLKLPHVHLVLRSPKRHRICYWLNRLSEIFEKYNSCGQLSTDGICIQVTESFSHDIQYLIHKNNPDKYQYLPDEIYTNLTLNDLVATLKSEDCRTLTIDRLIDIICHSHDLTEVMRRVGLSYYNQFYRVIRDLLNMNLLGSQLCDLDLPDNELPF